LFEKILQVFEKERATFSELMETPEKIEQLLQIGEKKAAKIANETLQLVRKRVGVRG
jgi:soluble cytochrome b562